nr:hypothetical protein [Streptomyces sp. DSM 41633]
LADLSDAISELRVMVAAESLKMWKADGTFRAGPSRELRARLMRVRSAPARTVLTVLEGICYGAAGAFFANASSVVRIDRGSIMPLPERWLPDVQTPGTPPNPITVHPTLLDRRCNFVLWDHEWELELDYTFRDRLDLVCAVRMPCEDKRDADGTITRLAY